MFRKMNSKLPVKVSQSESKSIKVRIACPRRKRRKKKDCYSTRGSTCGPALKLSPFACIGGPLGVLHRSMAYIPDGRRRGIPFSTPRRPFCQPRPRELSRTLPAALRLCRRFVRSRFVSCFCLSLQCQLIGNLVAAMLPPLLSSTRRVWWLPLSRPTPSQRATSSLR